MPLSRSGSNHCPSDVANCAVSPPSPMPMQRRYCAPPTETDGHRAKAPLSRTARRHPPTNTTRRTVPNVTFPTNGAAPAPTWSRDYTRPKSPTRAHQGEPRTRPPAPTPTSANLSNPAHKMTSSQTWHAMSPSSSTRPTSTPAQVATRETHKGGGPRTSTRPRRWTGPTPAQATRSTTLAHRVHRSPSRTGTRSKRQWSPACVPAHTAGPPTSTVSGHAAGNGARHVSLVPPCGPVAA